MFDITTDQIKLIDKRYSWEPKMGIIFSGSTDIGRKRKTNQDSICLSPENQFYAVADGMGGHNGGDIASQLSVKIMPDFVKNNSHKEPYDMMKDLVVKINKSILEKASHEPELQGMGTTVSAICFRQSNLFIANVGDSRVYLVNKRKLYQLTRDHSFVQEKINMGIYSRQEAQKDPQKNVLVRSVGFEAELNIDVFNYRISKNDVFMICSDGLHGKVSDKDILYILNKNIPTPSVCNQNAVDTAVKELIDLANKNGGQDNISVIIAVAQA